jgi:hypothetical protein
VTDFWYLTALEQPRSPFDGPVPYEHAREAHWVRPQLVGEVEYRTLTGDCRLRHAAWCGLRRQRPEAGDVELTPGGTSHGSQAGECAEHVRRVSAAFLLTGRHTPGDSEQVGI